MDPLNFYFTYDWRFWHHRENGPLGYIIFGKTLKDGSCIDCSSVCIVTLYVDHL